MKNKELVIWDLDGTVLDSFGIYCDLLAKVAPLHGFEVPAPEILRANFHGSLEDSINQALGGMAEQKLTDVVEDFLELQDAEYEVVEDHLFADALMLMKRAHSEGAGNILVTNREHAGRLKASPRHIVETTELAKYIDMVICGDDSQHRKPKPEVLGGLRIVPEHTVVIGDQYVDAQFAHNLGAHGILVARGGEQPANLQMLEYDWGNSLIIVPSLHDIELEKLYRVVQVIDNDAETGVGLI